MYAVFLKKGYGCSFSSFPNVDFKNNKLPDSRLRSKLKINIVNYMFVL